MMNSSESSTAPSTRSARWPAFGLLAVALLGFIDAAYLTIEHYLDRIPPCSIAAGCEKVTTGPYSVIFGIPTALMGALYYLAIILAMVYYMDARKEWVLKGAARFTAVGFLFSLWLVYLQLFVIKAICVWCMFSALSSTALFILGLLVLRSLHNIKMNHVP